MPSRVKFEFVTNIAGRRGSSDCQTSVMHKGDDVIRVTSQKDWETKNYLFYLSKLADDLICEFCSVSSRFVLKTFRCDT